MKIVDASVLVRAVADDGSDGESARRALSGTPLAAPEIIDLEVISSIRRLHRAGLLTDERSSQSLLGLATAPVERASHRSLIPRVWDLRDNLTAYDASYVALAEAMEATLVTSDRRLASAPGLRCEVELIS